MDLPPQLTASEPDWKTSLRNQLAFWCKWLLMSSSVTIRPPTFMLPNSSARCASSGAEMPRVLHERAAKISRALLTKMTRPFCSSSDRSRHSRCVRSHSSHLPVSSSGRQAREKSLWCISMRDMSGGSRRRQVTKFSRIISATTCRPFMISTPRETMPRPSPACRTWMPMPWPMSTWARMGRASGRTFRRLRFRADRGGVDLS
mmetsp:Transcript_34632/g.101798  ORF Transcript_34632/g.101798 Transcript_34632/m.101798 type:complete len:203 (-) Transcript_34632:675-1283(-)